MERDSWIIDAILVGAIVWGLIVAFFVVRSLRKPKKGKGNSSDFHYSDGNYDSFRD